MVWRKWLVRILVFSTLGGLAGLGLAYQAWTNPTATRQQVLDTMNDRFSGATVSLESARLRLLGGIAFSDLRLARKDDPEKQDFLHVPSGVLFHDKEHLRDGKVAIRQIQLDRPRLHVVREKDGRLNLDGVIGEVTLKERVPTIVWQQGTIVIEDRGLSTVTPVVEIKDVALTLINDPLPTLNIEFSGQTDVAGKITGSFKVDRATGATTGTLDLPLVPVSDSLIQRLAALVPDAGNHLRFLKGDGKLHAALDFDRARNVPLRFDATLELSRATLTHARLPLPIEDASATIRVCNGQIPFAHLTAHSGTANIELTVKDLTLPRNACGLEELPPLETVLHDFDLRIEHLQMTDELYAQLPESMKRFCDPYAARGTLTYHQTVHREPGGKWCITWGVNAENLRATYEHFKYPFERISGMVDTTLNSDGDLETNVNVQGYTENLPVRLRGTIKGKKQAPEIKLELWAENVPLDQKLLAAMPDDCRKVALQFLPDKSRKPAPDFKPMGLGDFKVYINREAGAGDCDFKNRFVIKVHDACVKYDVFPYPLENVSATLDILPDHWECHDCCGTHKGGKIHVTAQSFQVPNPLPAYQSEGNLPPPQNQRVQVFVHGSQILLDDADFLAALGPRPNLQQTWKQLAIAGRMNFDAVVVDEPGQPQNLDVGVTIQGCRMCPHFFPYALEDVSGQVRYVQDSVYLTDVQARHGNSVLSLKQGRVILKPGATGFQQVRLKGIKGSPLQPDAALVRALPEGLQEGLDALHLSDPVDIATDLVISQPPEPNTPLIVWWDGRANLKHVALHAGVDVSDVSGELSCCGLHNGKRVEKVVGSFLLTEGKVLGQPMQNVHGRLEILPDSPAILRFRDLSGNLFTGTIGGEARIEFGPILRYDLYLKALGVQLDQFGQHNLGTATDMQGAAMAAIHLTGEGNELAALKGEGRLDVPSGKLYKLPPLLDLLKAFGLRVPDRIAFEQAHAAFKIDGPQLHIQQLDLYGNAISLRGQGTVNLDGTDLNLDFNADWGRMNQLFPDEVTELSRAVSDQLLKIKMRGRIGDVKTERVFVPAIVEPAKRALQKPAS
jgi:AsmA-like C-terminal region